MYKATIYYLDKNGRPSVLVENFESELEAMSAVGLAKLVMEREKNPDTFTEYKIEKLEE